MFESRHDILRDSLLLKFGEAERNCGNGFFFEILAQSLRQVSDCPDGMLGNRDVRVRSQLLKHIKEAAVVAGGSNGQYFDGLIDQPIVFDRALSAAEVLNLYNDGIEGEQGGND